MADNWVGQEKLLLKISLILMASWPFYSSYWMDNLRDTLHWFWFWFQFKWLTNWPFHRLNVLAPLRSNTGHIESIKGQIELFEGLWGELFEGQSHLSDKKCPHRQDSPPSLPSWLKKKTKSNMTKQQKILTSKILSILRSPILELWSYI